MAVMTGWLAWSTRNDVKASRKIAEEAASQTKAAWSQRDLMNKTSQATRELITETIKSRADARGPRVAVLLELPNWPPRHPGLSAEQPSVEVESGRRFTLPGEQGFQLCLRASGTMVNEGLSTAIITHNGPCPIRCRGASPTRWPLG